MRTKDGFNYPGIEAEILTGSFGRKQLQVSGGINNANTDEEGSWDMGNFALFGAGSFFMEDGWRDNSPSKVNQVFGKASYQGEKLDLNFSTLLVKTELVGNGLLPSEMYARDPSSVFTSPDTTDNTLTQFQLSGSYFVNDNFSITAQAYKRKSKRHQINGDVYTEHDDWPLKRDLAPGEEYTCLYNTTNEYGLPDYYVVSIPGGNQWDLDQWPAELMDFAFAATLEDAFATLPAAWKNATLPPEMVASGQHNFHLSKNLYHTIYYQPGHNGGGGVQYNGPVTPWSQGNPSYQFDPGWDNTFPNNTNVDPFSTIIAGGVYFNYYTGTSAADSTINILLIEPATNRDRCLAQYPSWAGSDLTMVDDLGRELYADGGAAPGLNRPGVVEGTPTAVITDTQIDQETDGASIQFNWNFEKHKFMIGASIDAPSATYGSGQRFGMLDAKRHAFLAPELIRDQYTAADYEIRNNDFEGSQITKSIYASETWSPIETLHITGAMRYNDTKGQNEMASRTWGGQWRELHTIENHPDFYDVCRPGEECETGY
ncbi:MAG: TonB-dependent receptor, partial [Nitrosomonadales bacterium]|nr:TonB-dependent receptor [Nitrosomonadales bacterium]